MATLQIDLSGKNGLAPRFWGDMDRTISTPNLRYLANEGQMAEGIYNPFRRYGYCSPSNSVFANITGSDINNVTSASIYDVENDDFYMAVRGEEILKGTQLSIATVGTPLDLGATGTPVLMDLEIYQLNGTRKLFYCYKKSGYVEIGTASLPFASANNDWLSVDTTNPLLNQSLTNDVFMRVADNGYAYIFMDNQVHKLDGTTAGGAQGTITANALLFPANFQIIDAFDYGGLMYIAIQQSTKDIRSGESIAVHNTPCGVYIWDRLTSVVRTRDYIPLKNVKQIRNIYVSPTGTLRMICVNTERITEVREFNGRTFVPIQEVGLSAFPQFIDSLTNFSNFTIWLGVDGYIYAYGKVSPFDKEGIFIIGKIQDTLYTTGAVTGAIFFGGDNNYSTTTGYKKTRNGIYLGYRETGGSYYLKNLDLYGTGADNVTSLQEQGDVYTPVKYLPQMSNVNHLDVYMYPGAGSGATSVGTLKIYFNQSATPWASKTITRDDSANGYKRIEINKQYINSVQFEIEFNTSTSCGQYDFAPSFAIVDYTPTKTKG